MRRSLAIVLAIALLFAASFPALAATEPPASYRFTVMNRDTGKTIHPVTLRVDMEAETFEALTESELDAIAQQYLATLPQSRACSHSWVLKNSPYIFYKGPTDIGYYEGMAWVMDYECSRCAKSQTIITFR